MAERTSGLSSQENASSSGYSKTEGKPIFILLPEIFLTTICPEPSWSKSD